MHIFMHPNIVDNMINNINRLLCGGMVTAILSDLNIQLKASLCQLLKRKVILNKKKSAENFSTLLSFNIALLSLYNITFLL